MELVYTFSFYSVNTFSKIVVYSDQEESEVAMQSGRGGAREGAGRPTLAGEKAKMYSMKLPPGLVERIDAAAEAEGLNRTQWLIKAAEERLGKLGP